MSIIDKNRLFSLESVKLLLILEISLEACHFRFFYYPIQSKVVFFPWDGTMAAEALCAVLKSDRRFDSFTLAARSSHYIVFWWS